MGKVYNLLAFEIARCLQIRIEGIEAAEVQLVSRIGTPLAEPRRVAVRLALNQEQEKR